MFLFMEEDYSGTTQPCKRGFVGRVLCGSRQDRGQGQVEGGAVQSQGAVIHGVSSVDRVRTAEQGGFHEYQGLWVT